MCLNLIYTPTELYMNLTVITKQKIFNTHMQNRKESKHNTKDHRHIKREQKKGEKWSTKTNPKIINKMAIRT